MRSGRTRTASGTRSFPAPRGFPGSAREEFARFPTRIASVVENFPEDRYLDRKESKNWDRFARFGVWASLQAWEKANAAQAGVASERIGVWLGTGIGGLETLLRAQESLGKGDGWRVSPFTIPMMMANIGAALVSMALGARGPCLTPVSACATGNNSIGEAFLAVRDGRVDIAVAGGAEASIVPLAFSAFNSMRAMSTRNENPADGLHSLCRGQGRFRHGRRRGCADPGRA